MKGLYRRWLSNMSFVYVQTMLVHSAETISLTYFIELLLQKGKPVMLVGNAGVGKTILVWDTISKLKEEFMVAKVPFNYYTTSAMLQRMWKDRLHSLAFRPKQNIYTHKYHP